MTENVVLGGRNEERQAEIIGRLTPERRAEIIRHALPGEPAVGNSLSEVLANAGAGYGVQKRPIMAVVDADHAVEVPEHYATLRTDSWAPLGIVGKKFAVTQTATQLAPVEVLMHQEDIELTSVQVSKGGARVRVGGIIGTSVINTPTGPDTLCHFGVFEASHDGTRLTCGTLSTLRLICLNGLTVRDTVGSYGVRKTGNVEEKILEASRLILNLKDESIKEAKEFQTLADAAMSPAEMAEFGGELLASVKGLLDEAAEDFEAKKAERDEEIEELVGLFKSGVGNSGTTLWDGYNSVTEWIDHHEKYKNGKIRFDHESANFGAGNKVKGKARRMLLRRR